MVKIKPLIKIGFIIAFLIVTAIVSYFIFSKSKGEATALEDHANLSQSIAILPFVNASADSSQDYFGDGLTDEIINSLSYLKGLKVCARASSFKFKKKSVGIKKIGTDLGVSNILEGSFQLQGDRVIISAQLINVDDSIHLWSAKYDENLDEIFALQDKIANAIADKLKITLLGNQHQPGSKKQTTNIEAYQLYLKGRSFWNLKTPPALKKGIDFFQQVIKLDASYAAAYSGLADCYMALGYGSFLAPNDAFPKALEAATKAATLDSTLADAHASLGYYKFYYDWDWAAAEQEFRKCLALNPNYELGYDWYGYYLTAMERYDEASVILKKAASLDPLSVSISTDMGFSFYYGGNYDPAIKELKASLQVDSNFLLAHLWLGRSYQAQKAYPDAINELKKTMKVSVNWPVALAAIGSAYAESGDKINAKIILDTMISLMPKKFVTAYGIALVYSALGEKEEAFLWLNKAFDERSNWLVWLKTDPRWNMIKSDKRFHEMVNRVGLPQ